MAEDITLKLALVQASLIWQEPAENRLHLESLILKAAGNCDLIVLPEMFSTGFTMSPNEIGAHEGPVTLEWMQQRARHYKMAIMGSIAYKEKNIYTNRLFFVYPSGDYEYYDKRHTFSLAGEDKVYASGSKKLVLDYKGFRICPLICYDLRFPVWARNTNRYDILIFVANWPKPRILAWDVLLCARAIENQSYCVGVNRIGHDPNGHEYPGHSAVYDSLGKRLTFSDKEEIILSTLHKSHLMETREKLRFLDDQDHFTLQH